MVQYKYDAWGNHSVQDANGADINDAAHVGSVNPFRYRGYYYGWIKTLYRRLIIGWLMLGIGLMEQLGTKF